MNEDTAKIFTILLNPMVEFFDVTLLQKTNHFLFELTTPLSRDDLDECYLLFDSFGHYAIELIIYLTAFIEDIMQIEL